MKARLGPRWRLGLLTLVLVSFATTFCVAGYLYHEAQHERLDAQVLSEVTAVGNLKADQVREWLEERVAAAEVNAVSPYLAQGIERFLADRSASARAVATRRLDAERRVSDLKTIVLMDSGGRLLLCAGDPSCASDGKVRSLVRTALRTRRISRSDIYTCSCREIRMDLVVPITRSADPSSPLIAVLVERYAPGVRLLPELARWPGARRSSKTTLVQRDASEVVVIDPAEWARGNPPVMRLRPAATEMVGAVAAATARGVIRGKDERGVPVEAYACAVSGTAWTVLAKMDAEEVDAPLRGQALGTVGAGAAMFVMAGLGVGLLWRGQATQFTRELAAAQRERRALARHLEHLIKYANDIILLLDGRLKVVDFNDRAVQAYGYSPDELKGMPVSELIASGQDEQTTLKGLGASGGLVYETVHRRKDGTSFFAESSVRAVEAKGSVAYQLIIRDVSTRKATEQALASYQRRLKDLASEVSLAEERERRRIAVGLHDQIGQTLAVLKLRLGALFESPGLDESRDLLAEAREALDDAIQDTRSLTFELSPPILYELGLVPALEWLAEHVQGRYGVVCVVDDDGGSKPLGEDTRSAVFTCVRELLMNVVKHAAARQARVDVRTVHGALAVTVSDDGVGFDLGTAGPSADKPDTFGLFSLRERVEHLGGSVQLWSRPGSGTTVTLTVPLAKAPTTDEPGAGGGRDE